MGINGAIIHRFAKINPSPIIHQNVRSSIVCLYYCEYKQFMATGMLLRIERRCLLDEGNGKCNPAACRRKGREDTMIRVSAARCTFSVDGCGWGLGAGKYRASLKGMYIFKFGGQVRPVAQPAKIQLISRSQKIHP